MSKTSHFTGSTSGPELSSILSKNKIEIGDESVKPISKIRTSILGGVKKKIVKNAKIGKQKAKPRKLGVENKNTTKTLENKTQKPHKLSVMEK